MSIPNPEPDYLDFAVRIAHGAGEILLRHACSEKQVEFKGPANLVTIADRASEDYLVAEIRRRFPDHAILTEESGAIEGGAGARRWIIDPLDGTTNYAHQFPVYSVSIAFEQEGELQCGVVYDPVRRETFRAVRGGGAWLDGRRIAVSNTASLEHGLLLTGFPYGFRDRIEEALGLFGAFLVRSQAVRRAGSAALDLCYVASGRADGFWELELKPWDTAAGQLILEEGGGRVSDFTGQAFRLGGPAILASNGRIHAEMLGITAPGGSA